MSERKRGPDPGAGPPPGGSGTPSPGFPSPGAPSPGASSLGAPSSPAAGNASSNGSSNGAAGTGSSTHGYGSYRPPPPGQGAANGSGRHASSNGGPWTGRIPLMPLAGRVVGSLPGVARIAAGSALNTAEWSLTQTVGLSKRLITATHNPEEMVALAHELGVAVNVVGSLAQSVAGGLPLSEAVANAGHEYGEGGRLHVRLENDRRRLRESGELLLARSRDVWDNETGHPAYEKIIGELTQDEARILILLVRKGPQASVDVRTGGPLGYFNSELIATRLTMIGPRAACRHQGDVPSYLNNLGRLGLLEWSAERLPDPAPYQVLEVQPDVLAAIKSVRFPKLIRRSVLLTPFGRDFCRAVFGESGPEPMAMLGQRTGAL